MPKLPYDSARDFAPITLIGRGPNSLIVRADSPFKSVADVLAAASAKPESVSRASQGNGTSAHLAGEMLDNLAKVNLLHVPCRGTSSALTGLVGGQADLFFGTAAAVAQQLDGGKVRARAGAPPAVLDKLNAAARKGAELPELRAKVEADGLQVLMT